MSALTHPDRLFPAEDGVQAIARDLHGRHEGPAGRQPARPHRPAPSGAERAVSTHIPAISLWLPGVFG